MVKNEINITEIESMQNPEKIQKPEKNQKNFQNPEFFWQIQKIWQHCSRTRLVGDKKHLTCQ